jgi:flagellar basal-body rod modification protein FlgD
MNVQNVSSSYTSNQTEQTTKGSFASYGSTEFMQMLMTQITHQNPMEPMNDADMMNQYVQLNSLTELQSINSSIGKVVTANQTGYAASLIGKTIKATGTDGKGVEGVVNSITVLDGTVQLQVGKFTVPLTNVTEVTGG